MSLSIDSRYITGIYALGQWFKVKKDSINVDSYSLINWLEFSPHSGSMYEVDFIEYGIGAYLPDTERQLTRYDNFKGAFMNANKHDGIAFIDADSGERVSFSLMEVRAFREDRPNP